MTPIQHLNPIELLHWLVFWGQRIFALSEIIIFFLLQILLIKALNWYLPNWKSHKKIDLLEEICDGNTAAAVWLSAVYLGNAILMAYIIR